MQAPVLFDVAAQIARSHVVSTQSHRIETHLALGQVLAQPAIAAIHVPPFRKAMMDGFAVHEKDLTAQSPLKVIDVMAAGDTKRLRIDQGQVVRVMTGAPVPENAAAVLRFEWCTELENGFVQPLRTLQIGESIQEIGEDGQIGDCVLKSGRRIGGIELAVLKSFGVATVETYHAPKIALIITGSELVSDVSQALDYGQIYGANDVFLKDALESDGAVVTVDYVKDDVSATRDILLHRVADADYIITTGGVSAGDYDYIRPVLESIGAVIHVEHILMRPGSPMVIASIQNTTIFGLSGNPAANFIQFESLVRPVIRSSTQRYRDPFGSSGTLVSDVRLKPVKHVRILRAYATIEQGHVYVDATFAQSSGIISSLANANCLIRVDETPALKGKTVPLHWLREPSL